MTRRLSGHALLPRATGSRASALPDAGRELAFRPSPGPSLGVELELQVPDARSGPRVGAHPGGVRGRVRTGGDCGADAVDDRGQDRGLPRRGRGARTARALSAAHARRRAVAGLRVGVGRYAPVPPGGHQRRVPGRALRARPGAAGLARLPAGGLRPARPRRRARRGRGAGRHDAIDPVPAAPASADATVGSTPKAKWPRTTVFTSGGRRGSSTCGRRT
jgi:hypothetical protein